MHNPNASSFTSGSIASRAAPILVTGGHRTGTTWVGKMLTASGEAAYISEPLNLLHRPGVLRAPVQHWYAYICEENEGVLLPALRETLAFRYHALLELASLRSRHDVGRMARDAAVFLDGRLRGKRPLLKDPFALFSAPWFQERLGCRVVITVRHPAGFASSLKRLEWPFDFGDLLAQPLLVRDHLQPFLAEIAEVQKDPSDVIAQAGLLWKILYQAAAGFQERHPGFLIVRHEDLSLDPVGGYRALYAALGLDFSAKAQETILSSSSADNPSEASRQKKYAVRLDSKANMHNWKKRLAPAEIARLRALTEETAARFYPEIGWE